jgi:hypothetical protein
MRMALGRCQSGSPVDANEQSQAADTRIHDGCVAMGCAALVGVAIVVPVFALAIVQLASSFDGPGPAWQRSIPDSAPLGRLLLVFLAGLAVALYRRMHPGDWMWPGDVAIAAAGAVVGLLAGFTLTLVVKGADSAWSDVRASTFGMAVLFGIITYGSIRWIDHLRSRQSAVPGSGEH